MDKKDRDTMIEGFRLLGAHGREALEELQSAIDTGEIGATEAGEAQAQVEDLNIPG